MQNGFIRTPTPMKAVLRAGQEVLVARFQELVRCDFPLPGREPIAVEIPPEGRRSSFGRLARADHPPRELITVMHLPRYLDGHSGTERPGRKAAPNGDDRSRLQAATPLLGIATRTEPSLEDGIRTRSASVLLGWASGTAVVVTLDVAEGAGPDGPLDEWHLRSSQGLSLARGFEVLQRESQPAPRHAAARQWLYVAPGPLGTGFLGEAWTNGLGSPWTHEWRFERAGDLSERLERLADRLTGLTAEIQ